MTSDFVWSLFAARKNNYKVDKDQELIASGRHDLIPSIFERAVGQTFSLYYISQGQP